MIIQVWKIIITYLTALQQLGNLSPVKIVDHIITITQQKGHIVFALYSCFFPTFCLEFYTLYGSVNVLYIKKYNNQRVKTYELFIGSFI